MPGIVSSIGVGFLAGMINVPHCAAMCGSLARAACACGAGSLPWLRYQLGRSIGYLTLGALAGQFGDVIAKSGLPAVVMPLLSALVLCALAVRVATGRGATPPALTQLRAGRSFAQPRWRLLVLDAGLLGALSSLLPCGALGAALLLAALSGSASSGAALMAGFVACSGIAIFAASWLLGRLMRARRTLLVAALMLAAAVSVLLPLAGRPLASADAHHLGHSSCH